MPGSFTVHGPAECASQCTIYGEESSRVICNVYVIKVDTYVTAFHADYCMQITKCVITLSTLFLRQLYFYGSHKDV